MTYINIKIPAFPYFILSGNAKYRPGDRHARRSSIDCFDLLLVETGALHMCVKQQAFTLHPGDALIIPPGTPHHGGKICTEETFFHWLHFVAAGDYYCSERPETDTNNDPASNGAPEKVISFAQFQSLPEDVFKKVCPIMVQLESVAFNRYEKSTKIIGVVNNPLRQQTLLMQILEWISLLPSDKGTDDIAFLVFQYISANYSEKIELHTLAEIANCHPTHVIRCVKKQYGVTPMQLLTNIRLQRACELLRQTTMPVTEIAYAVGFSSPAYFGKQFKQVYKVSPKQCR